MKKLFFISISIFLSIILVEIGLQFISLVINFNSITTIDHRINLSPFKDHSWADTLFVENKKLTTKHYPYSGWKAIPTFELPKYYKIDSLTQNRTVLNHYSENDSSAKKVWVFGGSTIWGVYQRTEKTIPSLLSEYSFESGLKWNVQNMGQLGYVYSQNLMDLIQLLKIGKRPDFVIFYIGCNDVISSFHYKTIDAIPLSEEIDKSLEHSRENYLNQVFESTRILIVENSKIYKACKLIYSMILKNEHDDLIKPEEKKKLESGIIKTFSTNNDFLDFLSKSFDFKYQIILQPIIFFKKPKTLEELHLDFDPNCSDSILMDYTKNCYNNITSIKNLNTVNFADSLNDYKETAFIDLIHISEGANELMAKKIFSLIKNKLK